MSTRVQRRARPRLLLRAIGTSLAAAAVIIGPLTEAATAHLNLQPRLVEQGRTTDLIVDLPRLREGAAPVKLSLEGRGLRMLTSRLRETSGIETRWDVRVEVNAPPGLLDLILRAGYADGSSVDVDERLTVLPRTPDEPFPWVALIAGSGLGVAFAAAALLLGRRRTVKGA